MPDFLGFQYTVILDLYWILFLAVVIFGPEHDFLFKSVSTYCGVKVKEYVALTVSYIFCGIEIARPLLGLILDRSRLLFDRIYWQHTRCFPLILDF